MTLLDNSKVFQEWQQKAKEYAESGGEQFAPASGGMTIVLGFSYKFSDNKYRTTTDVEDAAAALQQIADEEGLNEKVHPWKMRPTFVLHQHAEDRVTGWEMNEDFVRNIVAYPSLNEATNQWEPHFMYKLFWASLTGEDRDEAIPGYVKPVNGVELGKKFWGVLGQVVDPGYDKNDESTWDFTTRTVTRLNEETGEEKEHIVPRRYVYIREAFPTKAELVEWLTSQGWEVDGADNSDGTVTIPMPDLFKSNLVDFPEWGEENWGEIVSGVLGAAIDGDMTNVAIRKKAVKAQQGVWEDTPVNDEVVDYILAYQTEPPF